jgi:hypothetical protein
MNDVIDFKSKKRLPENVINKITRECYHGSFLVDESKNHVECAKCKAILNPMWVLIELAQNESRNRWKLQKLKEEIISNEQKMNCKCDKCGKMTRISRKV